MEGKPVVFFGTTPVTVCRLTQTVPTPPLAVDSRAIPANTWPVFLRCVLCQYLGYPVCLEGYPITEVILLTLNPGELWRSYNVTGPLPCFSKFESLFHRHQGNRVQTPLVAGHLAQRLVWLVMVGVWRHLVWLWLVTGQ